MIAIPVALVLSTPEGREENSAFRGFSVRVEHSSFEAAVEEKAQKKFKDRLGKFLFSRVFGEYTRLEVGTDLLPDTLYADVLLIPEAPLPPTIPGAGLLARLTGNKRCLVEPYSYSPSSEDLQTSIAKIHLALRRAYRDNLGAKPPRGCLWILTPIWPKKAISDVFAVAWEEREPGLYTWEGLETIYLVNTSVIGLREETLLFRLVSRGGPRKEAVLKIFREQLEPYVTLLNDFDLRFKQMAVSAEIQQIDPRLLEDWKELRDTREEVLRELGRKEGHKEGLENVARRMRQQGFSVDQIAGVTGLSPAEIEALREK